MLVRDLAFGLKNEAHEVGVVFLDEAKSVGRDIGFEKEYIQSLNKKGISTYTLGSNCRRNPILGILRLRKIVHDFNPDILHNHLYYTAIFSLFINNSRTKLVYTHHNIKLGVWPILYKLLDLRFSTYIGICNACTNMLKSLTNKRVTRIDNGVDIKKILRKVNKSDCGTLTFVLIGRLCKQKNIELLIESVALLKELDFKVVIVGEGELESDLKGLVNLLDVDDKIQFLGNIKNVPQILNQADVFLLSSNWEGLPISQIEATLTGLPCVVTNVGGCAEIVHKVCNGIVVDELEPTSYSEAIKKMILDPELRESFSKNALNYSSVYEVQNSIRKHIRLYKLILSEQT